MTVYLNGQFLNAEDAKVSVLDRGFIFGDGVYEVWRLVDGTLFEHERHERRLKNGLKTLEIDAKGYDAILDVNLRGTLYMSQAAIPHMRKQKSGSIVCMSSVSAQRGGGIFGGPHYSAAKAGVLGLAKAMAREFGPDNIRVNSVTPGLIQTDITSDKLTPDLRAKILEGIPMNRLGDAEDVARACLFLASDLASYTTGAVIDVNGGMLIH